MWQTQVIIFVCFFSWKKDPLAKNTVETHGEV